MNGKRRGVMLIEAAVAGALLAVLALVAVRVLGAATLERRAVERHVIALQEAAGAMERVTALTWNELTAERLAEIRLSQGASQVLPGAELTWAVSPAETEPAAKHVLARLAWNSPSGALEKPVRLDYWAYRTRDTTDDDGQGVSP